MSLDIFVFQAMFLNSSFFIKWYYSHLIIDSIEQKLLLDRSDKRVSYLEHLSAICQP